VQSSGRSLSDQIMTMGSLAQTRPQTPKVVLPILREVVYRENVAQGRVEC